MQEMIIKQGKEVKTFISSWKNIFISVGSEFLD